MHREQRAEQDQDVADAEDVADRERARDPEDVAEELQVRVGDGAGVRRTPRGSSAKPAFSSACGAAGMTPPFAAIAVKFRAPPSATSHTHGIRRLRDDEDRHDDVGRDVDGGVQRRRAVREDRDDQDLRRRSRRRAALGAELKLGERAERPPASGTVAKRARKTRPMSMPA